MNPIDNYEDLTSLAEELANMRREMEAIQQQTAEMDDEARRLESNEQAEYEAYLARIEESKRRRAAIEDLMRDSRVKVRRLQKSIEDVDRKHQQAIMVRTAEEEFQNVLKTWDEITKDTPWSDKALDHQRDGAARIAYSRSVILADVMGLGKTLEAIMALDYLAAAQPEDTVEFIERKGYHRYSPEHQGVCDTCKQIDNKPGGPTYGDTHYDHYGEYHESRIVPAAGKKILYVAPVSLIRNVEREFTKWAPYREKPVVLTGYSKNQRRMALSVVKEMERSVVLINYEAWRKDLSLIDDLLEVGFDTIVIDEAHNVKDRRTIAYRGVRWLIDGHRTDARQQIVHEGTPILNVIPMTGTPILNRPQELYSLLTLVDKLQFPPTTQGENAFLRDYCYQDPYSKRWYFKAGGLESLAKKISNRFIRRTREDAGIKLPPQEIVYHNLVVDEELYPEQADVRAQMRDNAMILLDPARGHSVVAKIQLSVYLRLRQIETWPNGIKLYDEDGNVIRTLEVEESQKLDYIIHPNGSGEWGGLLLEVCPEEKTVIYSQFKPTLEEMHRRATEAGLRSIILDGDTPQSVRDDIMINLDRSMTSKEDSKYDVVLANYKVGGMGMNFTLATQTIILDEEWNPGKRDQAYGRQDRMGQTEDTTVHVIRMRATIDTWLANLIEEKEGMVGGFNDTMMGTAFFEALKAGEI